MYKINNSMNNRKPYEDLANLYFSKVLLKEEVDLRGRSIDFTYFPNLFNKATNDSRFDSGIDKNTKEVLNGTARKIADTFAPMAETDIQIGKELARLSHYLSPVDMSKPAEEVNDEQFDDEGIDDEDALGIDDTAPIR